MQHRTWMVLAASAILLTGCKAADAGPAAPPHVTRSASPTTGTGSSAATVSARDRTIHRDGHAFPDRHLTPGATIAGVTAAQVCTSGWASAHRHVTTTIRHQVFAAYGIPYSTHSRYELDHLIPLELGGSNSTKNLWPEPLTDDDSTGPSKDALENHLHALVCSHQLSLHAAQHAIADDWLAAWNRYEHIPVHRSSTSHRSTSGSSSPHRSSSGTSSSSSSSSSSHGGATARCKDGTYSYAAHHQGACSHHGGVAVWYR